MRLSNILFFYLIAFSIAACNQPKSQNDTQIIELIPEKAEELSLSSVFESLEYIVLESPERKDALISYTGVHKLFFDGNQFLFFEKNQSMERSIKAFDKNGEFLYALGDIHGPEGFPSAEDFLVDKKNKRLEILENFKEKILYFDLRKGEFLGQIKLEEAFQNFVKFNNGNYVFHAGNQVSDTQKPYNVHFSNPNGRILESYLPIPKYFYGFDLQDIRFSTASFRNSYLLWDLFSKDIFRVSEKGIEKSFTIESKYWIPQSTIDKFSKSGFQERIKIMNNQNFIVNINKLIEWDSNLFFIYNHNKNLYWSFYDKKKQEVTTFKISSFNDYTKTNDLDSGLNFHLPYGKYDDNFVFLIYPSLIEAFAEYLKEYRPDLYSSEQINPIYKTITSKDNPVIVLAKLKPEFR